MATKNTPAAGAKGGPAPLPTTLFVPDFTILHRLETKVLFHDLRCSLCIHLFGLLVIHSDFKTGEVLTNYARLMDLCRPPLGEKGGRGKGPTLRQVRYAIEQLITYGILKRNAEKNAAQGQLRLYVRKRNGATQKRPV